MNHLINFYECFLISLFVCKYFQMNKRFHKVYMFLLAFVLYVEVSVLNYYIVYEGYYSLLGIFTILMFSRIFTENLFSDQLLISIWIFCFISVINNVVLISTCILTNQSFINLARNVYLYFEVIIISKLLFTILVLALIKAKKNVKILLSRIYWLYLLCGAILSFIIFTVLETALFIGDFGEMDILIALLSLIILNVFMLVLFVHLSKENYKSMRNELLYQAMNQKQTSATYVEELNKQTKKLKHDLKHILGLLRSFLKNGQFDEAEKLLEEYVGAVEGVSSLIQTGHILFDYILNEKQFIAKSKGIHLYVNILNCDYQHIKDVHLCIVLGNLLDNAIENCSMKDREINLEITVIHHYLRIVVKNKIDNPVLSSNPQLNSKKANKNLHGYGIKSIKVITEMYEGKLFFDEDGNEFQCTVLLHMKPITTDK